MSEIIVGGKKYHNAITFDQAYERLALRRQQIQDIKVPLNAWKPTVDGQGNFVMEHDGRQFVPTDYALGQMAVIGGNQGGGLLKALRRDVAATNKEKSNGVRRGKSDAELMVKILENGLFHKDRTDQGKERLFRTWTDGTLRAVLSNQYAIVNNEWVLDVVKEAVPEGLFTRWRGDADVLRADLLVPDSVRQADDSDYGGQVSLGNSEIGNKRVTTACSIFRLVCTNGMIVAKSLGEATRKVHRGELDLVELRLAMLSSIKKQLSIMGPQIDNVLGLKAYGVGDVSMPLVFAQLAKQYNLGRNIMPGILDSYAVEAETVGVKDINSAFGAVQALTRFAQKRDDVEWESLETVAGQIADMPLPRWESLVDLSSKLGKADLDKVYGETIAAQLVAA